MQVLSHLCGDFCNVSINKTFLFVWKAVLIAKLNHLLSSCSWSISKMQRKIKNITNSFHSISILMLLFLSRLSKSGVSIFISSKEGVCSLNFNYVLIRRDDCVMVIHNHANITMHTHTFKHTAYLLSSPLADRRHPSCSLSVSGSICWMPAIVHRDICDIEA